MIMYLVMTAGAIIAAVFFNSQVTTVAKIAVVSDAEAPVLSTSFDVTVLDEMPPMSELVAGRYDAVVVFSGSDYQITSIRNAAFVSLIESG
ncbi:MAG: ThuA domain-containing protein, partial [Coriobacteriales bacterium]|nr:ThuA domain-containing protein [Coriobacteriales bacterium]